MATVTALTAARTLEIEDGQIASANVDVDGHLILVRNDDGEIDAGLITELTQEGLDAQYVTRVTHNGSVYASRPAGVPAGMAEYVGPTEPTTWLTGDTWVSTA